MAAGIASGIGSLLGGAGSASGSSSSLIWTPNATISDMVRGAFENDKFTKTLEFEKQRQLAAEKVAQKQLGQKDRELGQSGIALLAQMRNDAMAKANGKKFNKLALNLFS